MDEKRILEQLLASAQEISVPEGLCPEIMEKRLEQTAQKLRTARKSRRQVFPNFLIASGLSIQAADIFRFPAVSTVAVCTCRKTACRSTLRRCLFRRGSASGCIRRF